MYPIETPDKSNTWAEKIVDRNNLWIKAIHLEDEGRYPSAITFYAKDALACTKSHNLPKAALSCNCAAHCLVRIGEVKLATILFSEAASIYKQYSDEAIDKSVRESVWGLQRACENYLLAKEVEFDRARLSLTSIAKKISPIFAQAVLDDLAKYQQLVAREPPLPNSQKDPASGEGLLNAAREIVEFVATIRQLFELCNSRTQLAELEKLVLSESPK